MRIITQLPRSLCMALVAALSVSAAPAVNVGMRAAFPTGPYLLELLETAAVESPTSYFPLLDRIAGGHFDSATTEAALYASFLDVLRDDGHITNAEALSTFNLALSLRVSSPRIEAHYQYYETSVESLAGDVEDCHSWVLSEGKRYCTPALDKPKDIPNQLPQITDVPFDRPQGAGRDVVFYADPTSKSFGEFYQTLSEAAKKGEVRYRIRYRRTPGAKRDALPVSGYGVELALKRTDYIVIDDREADHDSSQKPVSSDVDFDDEEQVADLKPLSTSELAGLGLKAASFVIQNDKPLEALVKLTQDLPKFTSSIAAHEISRDFQNEHDDNRAKMAPPGLNYLWMNGIQLIERQIEPFTLVDMVRRERDFLGGVRDLGFSGKQATLLLGHQEVAESKKAVVTPRFDWTDRSEDGRVIIWLNDLEKDERYSKYSGSLRSIIQRTYPGQLPPLRLNIFTIIFPVDFSKPEDLDNVSQVMELMARGIPIRFGLVPLASNPDGSTQAKLAYHLVENYGVEALTEYLSSYQDKLSPDASEKIFADVIKRHTLQEDSSSMTFGEVTEADVYSEQVTLARKWSDRLGATTPSRPVFADGVAVPRDKNWMQAVSAKLAADLQEVQMRYMTGDLDEDSWLPGIFLEEADSTRNIYIVPEDKSALKVLNVNKVYGDYGDLFNSVPVLQSYTESSKEDWAAVTIIADLDSAGGRELLLEGLGFKRNNPGIRLDIVSNPASGNSAARMNSILRANEKKLGDMETLADIEAIFAATQDSNDSPDFEAAHDKFLSAHNLQRGEQLILVNGRVVGPLLPGSSFKEADFQKLFEFEYASRIGPVYAALEDLNLTAKLTDPLAAAKVTSITALSTISDLPEGIFESAPTLRTSLYEEWESKHTAIEIGDPETSSVHLVGLLNPLSEQGQRWAPIIKVLSELDGVYLKLFLNPKDNISELPVKRFFRYVLDSKPSFDEDGKLKTPNATFKGLPSEALLTTGMNVPPAWLVAPAISVHDLDNIKLSTVKGDVEALYELEHILIEGHSRQDTGTPPRGAQLVLGTESNPLLTDTIIMSNLGYFQFKANPGYYNIKLKEGRSSEIYTIDSMGSRGWEPVPGDQGTAVAVTDFKGTTLYPRLKRNPSMEDADVLGDDEDLQDGVFSRGMKFAENLFGGSKRSESVSDKEHAEINIFSVASGHLYERMLNIMMVSVMKNTKHTVKFWFIEQFLSPSFKEFIPHLAAEYGFKYEMVTYKWPHWLRQQKEKQREIWGYKILFLDVLFPLSLDKVIFVDADQIVRTDMMDLVNHDLEGAPYGFAPMGDSRTEMEGFRFWKQGYWSTYLRGRPYHISALYVVDLRRFRKLAAGDQLRQQYHTLSADPNSLSNLDQDLPNNMQFRIPIHTLPQEWLWCETWCSDESLADARTIDLCNNPQTKEPKLDRARRQVPEWTVYDDEIAALDRRRRGVDEKKKKKERDSVNTKSRRFEEEEPVHTMDEL